MTAVPLPLPRHITSLPRLAVIGGALCLFWLLIALAAPWIAPYDPLAQNLAATLQPPSAVHLLGTDNFGRDILSRIIVGTRYTLSIAVASVVLAGLGGIALGSIAALLVYHGMRLLGWRNTRRDDTARVAD